MTTTSTTTSSTTMKTTTRTNICGWCYGTWTARVAHFISSLPHSSRLRSAQPFQRDLLSIYPFKCIRPCETMRLHSTKSYSIYCTHLMWRDVTWWCFQIRKKKIIATNSFAFHRGRAENNRRLIVRWRQSFNQNKRGPCVAEFRHYDNHRTKLDSGLERPSQINIMRSLNLIHWHITTNVPIIIIICHCNYINNYRIIGTAKFIFRTTHPIASHRIVHVYMRIGDET